jgi:two-component system chemotaxis sensor kinase CheA
VTSEPDTTATNSLERFRQTYFEECAELLESVYSHLAILESGEADSDTVNAVFRAVHSIKGGGGAFGLNRLVTFAHVFETLLDMMRDGRATLGPDLLPLTLKATDMVADLVAGARSGQEPPAGTEDEIRQALSDVAESGTAPAATPTRPPPSAQPQAAHQGWRIHFTPHASLYSSANEPLLIFRDLARLGPLAVQADISRVPDLASFDPGEAYIAWRLELDASVTAERVADAFEFVTDDCDLLIEPIGSTQDRPTPIGVRLSP